MGGERRIPPATGHVDLSMTRMVLEALRIAGVPSSDPVFEKARVYVERCQNPDGGFHFTTTEYDTNKAGHDGRRFRSYGTATADGLLALAATETPPEDDKIVSARQWLIAQHGGVLVPGFLGEAYQRWPQGLSFYYAAIFTQAIGSDAAIVGSLAASQHADGSWSNPSNLVKEDDPLIATAFAIHALAGGGVEYSHGSSRVSGIRGYSHAIRAGNVETDRH
jgi:hypothetical protein